MNMPKLNLVVLTADTIRKQLPLICKKDNGSFKSEGAIKNILSGFNQMLKLGLLSQDRLVEQMESEFNLTQSNVFKYSKSNSNAKSWPSFLNDIRAAVNSIINFDTSRMTFGDTLLVISKREFGAHLSIPKLATELKGLEESSTIATLCLWLGNKNLPRGRSSFEIVKKLDQKLNANGVLISKVRPMCKESVFEPQKYNTDTVQLSSVLEQEIATYCAWRIKGVKPQKMSYLGIASTVKAADRRKVRQLANVKERKWQFDAKGICTGAITFRSDIQAFAKYIRDIHPERLEEFSLSSMFNYELVSGFGDYGKNRGVIPSTMRVLKRIASECDKNTYVSVYLYSEDKSIKNIDEWLEELDLLKEDIKLSISSLTASHKALEGARNVNWILEKSNPFAYINTISKGLWDFVTSHERDYADSSAAVIFDLLVTCPIRASNVCALQWKGELSEKEVAELHKEETCAIYWDSVKAHYVLYVHKQKLKNRKSSKVSSIIQKLPHLTTNINRYIEIRKKHLISKKWESCFFFVSIDTKAEKAIDFNYQRKDITSLLSSKTKSVIDRYFPEENVLKGINPHAMRHLMATLFLRYNNDNYSVLATLLMDDLATVMGVYAKRSDHANHEKISTFIGEMTND